MQQKDITQLTTTGHIEPTTLTRQQRRRKEIQRSKDAKKYLNESILGKNKKRTSGA